MGDEAGSPPDSGPSDLTVVGLLGAPSGFFALWRTRRLSLLPRDLWALNIFLQARTTFDCGYGRLVELCFVAGEGEVGADTSRWWDILLLVGGPGLDPLSSGGRGPYRPFPLETLLEPSFALDDGTNRDVSSGCFVSMCFERVPDQLYFQESWSQRRYLPIVFHTRLVWEWGRRMGTRLPHPWRIEMKASSKS